MRINFLEETEAVLENHGLNWNDVEFISVNNKSVPIESFRAVAEKIYYDAGYGLPEINSSCQIVGSNWWLGREEYDGAEWWEYRSRPVPCKDTFEDFKENDLRYVWRMS